MTRSEEREHVFLLLFLQDFHQPEELPEEVELYFHFDEIADKLSPEEMDMVKARFAEVMEALPQVDEVIEEVAVGWKPERMGRVDRTAVRLAVFELLMDDAIPTGVAINEAVELAKKYGGEQSPRFVNGVLARVTTR